MFTHSLAFDSPWYLALLALLPIIWVLSRRSLAGLGRLRRLVAIAFRSLVFTAIVLALADAQLRKQSDRLTVIYLLDQSQSIPEAQREAMTSFVNASVREHRRNDLDDRAGVIVFGREPEVELPPVDFFYELPRIESLVDRQHTNLEQALGRAMSLFPPDAAKRIVIVTDGNENSGDALRQARAMAAAGVSIDVLPVPLGQRSEVAVDKLTLPADVRRDQPFELRAVVELEATPGATETGRLRVVRKSGDRETVLSESPVTLEPGKNVFSIRESIQEADFYTYEARFVPDDPATDASTQNNLATAFTHVRGKGHVLLIEDWEHPGEFDTMVDALRAEGLEVTTMRSDRLFGSLAELQRYDTVVLANTPRSSGFGGGSGTVTTDSISAFSDDQIGMLVRNTEELGCGLVMIGGDRSFGAGGWDDTKIEEAMPLDFEIKAAKVTPVGALGMIMHASEIARGNYWQKRIAIEAVDALGERDYAGLLQWNGSDQWLWGQSQGGMITVGANRNQMKARIDRLTVGDMPQFDPAMKLAAASFAGLTNPVPAIKHMIIISDGDPSPPSAAVMKSFIDQKVKITTVAVGAHGPPGHATMQKIATSTGGKYYVVRNANALPRIYQREARRVSRPLVRELKPPVAPRLITRHEILGGLESDFPPLAGYVQTTVKDSSLVEVVLRSPIPADGDSSTILATWNYGLGKTAAFTSDAGARWADQWTGWSEYNRFYSQLIRWSMRPTGDTGNFTVATDIKDGKARVVIDALDKNDQFLELPTIGGAAVAPGLDSLPIVFRQIAPGRYVGEFEAEDPGSYMVVINPGSQQPMIRTGLNVGYSDEFRDRETNRSLLSSIASLSAEGGEAGKMIDEEAGVAFTGADSAEPLSAVDPYRRDLPPAVSTQPIWPLLILLGSCVFLADVFVRRVQVNLDWVPPLWARLRGRTEVIEPETMSRLRSRKQQISDELGDRRAQTRFEVDEDAPAAGASPLADLERPAGERRPTPTTDKESLASEEKAQEEGYTSRLLKAKRDALKKKDDNQ
ncbi:von Willebrand factor type A domain protein [Pseudobythopirellula maris]|uniref:von Willebrand factor type A domain protein n=1 Tax=Pseudobythopirellula maris TaxID=2527991 RepID=A0A5C5ZRK6_9BACT|nr:VWA domain-containing protein [Pseudobythopirellula maris]TWT90182.1 von Willebrand factor type A domain protein [Pseudobythopirellula maris]